MTMLMIRRVGNSLGVIIPKETLDAWGLEEGDQLFLSEAGISPHSKRRASQDTLEELKRKLAAAVGSLRDLAPYLEQLDEDVTKSRRK